MLCKSRDRIWQLLPHLLHLLSTGIRLLMMGQIIVVISHDQVLRGIQQITSLEQCCTKLHSMPEGRGHVSPLTFLVFSLFQMHIQLLTRSWHNGS